MEYTNLGSTGLKVSRICLGTLSFGDPSWREWVLGLEDAEPIVKTAIAEGINFFDTANTYSFGASEEVIGKLLSKYARRDEVVVATKVFHPDREEAGPNDRGLSRKAVSAAIERSLARLGMDYVDLYQIHRFDPDVPIEETMGVLHDLVEKGKARYIGASSMEAWQFAEMQETARTNGWTEFISMQNQYSLLYREEEREMIPLCISQGVGLLPWSPLARGRLARPIGEPAVGTTLRSKTDHFQDHNSAIQDSIVETAAVIARELGAHQAQVAIAWLLAKPGVIAPVVGATKPGHLEAAIAAVEIKLDAEQMELLERYYEPMPVVDH
jgi:aryl-alcohol dehydrogenase-like predicted oxidoreductase